jgi:hypothetical protein
VVRRLVEAIEHKPGRADRNPERKREIMSEQDIFAQARRLRVKSKNEAGSGVELRTP